MSGKRTLIPTSTPPRDRGMARPDLAGEFLLAEPELGAAADHGPGELRVRRKTPSLSAVGGGAAGGAPGAFSDGRAERARHAPGFANAWPGVSATVGTGDRGYLYDQPIGAKIASSLAWSD